MSGIYEIKNKLNNHRYIGSSVNINKRFYEHLNTLRKNKHHSKSLQRAWNKYGESQFEFNVLESCEPIKDTLLFIEQKYLDLNPEYNICKYARNTQGVVFSEERRNKIGLANSRRIIKDETRIKHSINSSSSIWAIKQMKPVYMIDLKTNLIIREFKNLTEAGRYLGNPNKRVNVKRVINGKQKHAYGYYWALKEDKNDL